MRLSLGIIVGLLLFSCSKEQNWKVSDRYPNGEVKIQKGYLLEGQDTVFNYLKVFYNDGNLQLEGALKDGERTGKWTSYFQQGGKWSETHFENGKSQGESKSYYENGNLRYEGNYSQGEKAGHWNLYDSTGTKMKGADYDKK